MFSLSSTGRTCCCDSCILQLFYKPENIVSDFVYVVYRNCFNVIFTACFVSYYYRNRNIWWKLSGILSLLLILLLTLACLFLLQKEISQLMHESALYFSSLEQELQHLPTTANILYVQGPYHLEKGEIVREDTAYILLHCQSYIAWVNPRVKNNNELCQMAVTPFVLEPQLPYMHVFIYAYCNFFGLYLNPQKILLQNNLLYKLFLLWEFLL